MTISTGMKAAAELFMAIVTYRDLVVWQKSMTLAERIYNLTSTFPPEERYGLSAQLRRAAISIPSNVAEGYARRATGQYVNQLRVALGSEAELQTQLELSRRLGLVAAQELDSIVQDTAEVGRLLTGLVRSIEPFRR